MRLQLSDLLERVFRKELRVIVERSGIPVAALVAVQDLDQIQSLESQALAAGGAPSMVSLDPLGLDPAPNR